MVHSGPHNTPRLAHYIGPPPDVALPSHLLCGDDMNRGIYAGPDCTNHTRL